MCSKVTEFEIDLGERKHIDTIGYFLSKDDAERAAGHLGRWGKIITLDAVIIKGDVYLLLDRNPVKIGKKD